MNNLEKKRFINGLIKNVQKEIISKVWDMPLEWDGIELRQYIADNFSDCIIKGTMSKSRKQKYNNTIYTTNL